MTDLTFYTNPMSRGRMVRWMLEEVGHPYDTVVLDFGPPMKSPEYRAINPMGKVPALRHGATTVTECGAIIAYLAMAFPDAGLLPDDRGHFLRWMFYGAGPLEAAVTMKSLGVEVPKERRAMVGFGHYDRVVDTLDTLVQTAPFLAGDRFSALDVYVGSQIAWGLRFGTLPDRPTLAAYAARITARPAALRASQIDDALLPAKA